MRKHNEGQSTRTNQISLLFPDGSSSRDQESLPHGLSDPLIPLVVPEVTVEVDVGGYYTVESDPFRNRHDQARVRVGDFHKVGRGVCPLKIEQALAPDLPSFGRFVVWEEILDVRVPVSKGLGHNGKTSLHILVGTTVKLEMHRVGERRTKDWVISSDIQKLKVRGEEGFQMFNPLV